MNARTHPFGWTLRDLALAMGFALGASSAAADAVAVPPEFRSPTAGTTDAVVYAESSGAYRNPIDRVAIEAQCEMARRSGLGAQTPIFEAGFDQPLKVQNKHYSNAHRSALLTVREVYQCDAQPARNSVQALCGCTYRLKQELHAHIDNRTATQHESLRVDFAKGMALRRVTAIQGAANTAQGRADSQVLFPEVIGSDAIAGFTCTKRRLSLAGRPFKEHCVADDPRLPDDLKGRSLGETTFGKDATTITHWMRTDKVLLDAVVDAGVFGLPSGLNVKEIR